MSRPPVEPLSYSSSSELLGCEQKYVYRKVQKVDKDTDASDDRTAMDIGTVLHQCLEDYRHDLNGFKMADLERNMVAVGLDEAHTGLLWAMLRKYKDLQEKTGLKVLKCEAELLEEEFLGFVDVVMEEADGPGWWIVDVKTAGRLAPDLAARLPMDRQLNLYRLRAQSLGDPETFLGCRYRVVTKSTAKRKSSESLKDYSDRLYRSISAVDFIIPRDVMKPEVIDENFRQLRKRQSQLVRKTRKPVKNFSHCFSYFRPCEYYSRCHGATFTSTPRVTEVSV